MKNLGFIKVAVAIPELKVADCSFNRQRIENLIKKSADQDVQIVCFPELSITGYTCADLFNQQFLLEQSELEIKHLLESTTICFDTIFIIGAPIRINGKLYNAAVVCQSGKILGIIPKTHLPNYNEFHEQRWFVSSKESVSKTIDYAGCEQIPFGTDILFGDNSFAFAVEICEDLWVTIPPSSNHALNGVHIIFNLSASNELAGKNDYVKSLIQQQSARCIAGYVYASSGYGESSTDIVFSGNGLIYENGTQIAHSKRFLFEEQLIVSEIDIETLQSDRQKTTSFKPVSEYRKINIEINEQPDFTLNRNVNPHPFIPSEFLRDNRCDEIFSIQTGGLARRMLHTQLKTAVIGISGGLDSTLALLVTVKTFDKIGIPRENIIGVTMPGFGTTDRTYENAQLLMKSLGITIREINIIPACEQHFKDIGHDAVIHDVTYENSQARERTQILMDIANQTSGLVIGTGNLSELALGWCTYSGDHISMYAVNAGIPKTLVRHLVGWLSKNYFEEKSRHILLDIIDTPISPELLPSKTKENITQKTEDIVGPYELHDFFLYYTVRFGFTPEKILFLAKKAFNEKYSRKTLLKWMNIFFKRFFSQQFKRSCMPDGPKTGSVNLSPRGDWKMPSDGCCNIWEQEINRLMILYSED